MNKPKWEDAPEGYDYLAQDENGSWWWHVKKPTREQTSWVSQGTFQLASRGVGWRNTLEERPKRPRIREDIKAGDYLYSWRHQGYVKVIEVVEGDKYTDVYTPGQPYLIVSHEPFSRTQERVNMNGVMLEPVPHPPLPCSHRYDFFNDLDTYYEFVKATTNTPTKE